MRGLEFNAVTPERWRDLEQLFGPRGACAGCWCMWWRIRASEYEKLGAAGRRNAMRRIVAGAEVPGILAYVDGEPAGWCSVAPRQVFSRLERSQTLRRVDEQAVWSIVCLFVDRRFRRRGLTVALIEAAVEHARLCGATIVEGYPIAARRRTVDSVSAYIGVTAMFRRAKFMEVARPSPRRRIMRRILRRQPARILRRRT